MLTGDDPTQYFVLRSAGVLCTTFPILIFVFVPKTIYLHRALNDSEDGTKVGSGEKARISIQSKSSGSYSLKNNSNKNYFSGIMFGDISTKSATKIPTKDKKQGIDPKGMIGIRIVQSVFLDGDEVDKLQGDVDKAERRYKQLRDTFETMKGSFEDAKMAANAAAPYTPVVRSSFYLGKSMGNLSFNSKDDSSKSHQRNDENAGSIGSIVESRPTDFRHSMVGRRMTYHK
mmetsp:Transcript_16566/g.34096  ORF Transcript_16566/g.34096 Transcript_16566/m.34096 type:complete len:230 (-) Transcript_16566:447-1136(-)